jgi:alpha-methylacyl-CoA racemase
MRPLEGIRVIEMGGIPTAGYCGMLLADFGADVVVVDRPVTGPNQSANDLPSNPLIRGKRFIRVDLKSEQGIGILRRMIEGSDVLIEPNRPGVMEALGLGPDQAIKINEKLIYARLTGWGQNGPLAQKGGHDINYIAVSGALSLFRRKGERPLPPCNLLGDFAGGGMLCAMGVLLALVERNRSGKGQVVDSAMVDGAASLSVLFHGMLASGTMSLDIGSNMLDGGAPFYQTYETADGKFLAVGAIEPKFYKDLLEGMGLDPSALPAQRDTEKWPEMKARFAQIFKTRTREEWDAVFSGKDACVSPVLELNELGEYPHNQKRQLMIPIKGFLQPAPAPRLSRTPGSMDRKGASSASEAVDILEGFGYTENQAQDFLKTGAIK